MPRFFFFLFLLKCCQGASERGTKGREADVPRTLPVRTPTERVQEKITLGYFIAEVNCWRAKDEAPEKNAQTMDSKLWSRSAFVLKRYCHSSGNRPPLAPCLPHWGLAITHRSSSQRQCVAAKSVLLFYFVTRGTVGLLRPAGWNRLRSLTEPGIIGIGERREKATIMFPQMTWQETEFAAYIGRRVGPFIFA